MAIAKRIFLFIAVNMLIMLMLNIVLGVLNAMGFRVYGQSYGALMLFSLVWGMGGAFISLLLSKTIAKWSMGVRLVEMTTASAQQRSLVAVVTTLAERAGLPRTPEVGVYDSEEVNAFATGPTKSRALVAVSSGLLNRLSRDQIEAVLGHEITHIANGDMVTMTLLQGIVNAFVIFFSRIVAIFVGNQVEGRNRWMVEFATSIVLQIALGFLGSIVVCYFSRKREFRADAGGARLAGRQKMIDALRALGQTRELVAVDQQAVASLKIAGRGGMTRLFMTHPPLEERIAALNR